MNALLQAPRPAGEARATSNTQAVCEERATKPAGLRAAAQRGAAAGGHLLCCRSSTMSDIAFVAAPRICPPGARAKVSILFLHRPLHPAPRRSRQSANFILWRALGPLQLPAQPVHTHPAEPIQYERYRK